MIDVGRTQFPELYFDPYEFVVLLSCWGGGISVRIVVCEHSFCPSLLV